MEALIRPYSPSDLHACRALWAELTEHHRELYADPSIGGDDPGAFFDRHLVHPDMAGLWVAVTQDGVIGLAGLLVRGLEGEVEPVVVAARYRSQGIGRALLERVTVEAERRGVRFLSVRPVARNVEAIAFFVAAGFDTLGHIDLFRDLSPSPGQWKSGIVIHGHSLQH